jgi:transcriptional regulator with XRE-family HTH domain
MRELVMQPEQQRAARGALNWSLERLAEASGVHRNTISNFETRKYMGEPEKLAAVKRTLEGAGVIFDSDDGLEAAVSLRRFEIGDLVRFRPNTRVRFDYRIAADDIGEVVGVEPHPPATGPTYKIQTKFGAVTVPYDFKFEYELVRATPPTASLQAPNPPLPLDPAAILDEFIVVCTSARNDFDLYESLFRADQRKLNLLLSTAPLFFQDIGRILEGNLFLHLCKLTDPAGVGFKTNLTTNFILEKLPWQETVKTRLQEINNRLMAFRRHIEPARSKRLAHLDVASQVERQAALGKFPDGADLQFLNDLQEFINVAYGHLHNGGAWSIEAAMSLDTDQLVKALGRSVVFDHCSRCSAGERAVAVLDCFDGPE